MRVRNARSRMLRRDAAQVGIGTMIVFIATILVAAVAAAVMIDTSSFLQDRATATGKETTRNVATNLVLRDIIGHRAGNGPADPLTSLDLHVSLAPGAREVDLSQTVILVGNRSALLTLTYGNASDEDKYTALSLRDADGSFTTTTPVMTVGDLVRITIALSPSANDLTILPRQGVLLHLLPEVGGEVTGSFETPTSFGDSLVIKLR